MSVYRLVLSLMIILNAANLWAEPNLSWWLGRADKISVITVVSGKTVSNAHHQACRFQYSLEVIDSIQGKPLKKIVTDSPLLVGSKYLIASSVKTPWPQRAFGLGAPRSALDGELPAECVRMFGKASIIRGSEIRPIHEVRSYSINNVQPPLAEPVIEWVEFPPDALLFEPGLSVVRDTDRIDIFRREIGWPNVKFSTYVLLNDIRELLARKTIAESLIERKGE